MLKKGCATFALIFLFGGKAGAKPAASGGLDVHVSRPTMAGCHGFDMLLEPGVIGRGFKDLSRGNRWSVHVDCASKPAMRVMREVEKAGRNVTSVLRRKSRGLSRAVQLEVLDEFVQRERPELVLPVRRRNRVNLFNENVDLLCGDYLVSTQKLSSVNGKQILLGFSV